MKRESPGASSKGGDERKFPINRRELLKGILGVSTAAALTRFAPSKASAPGFGKRKLEKARPTLVAEENQRKGTREWLLRNTRIDPASLYRCPWIEGYCSRTSVRAGETIDFHVSTRPEASFTIKLFRMGYYGGTGARHITTLGPFRGRAQSDPPVGPNRVRDCQWEPCASLAIPSDWVSGVYIGKLTTLGEGLESYVIFIVRDDRKADLLFQCSDTTWQAYNRWPSQFALYDDGNERWYWGPGVDVSFNRPYGKYCQILDAPLSLGSGEWFLWEFPFAYWLESHGYDLTYTSNLDTHADAEGLLRAKAFLSVGHDEYYSLEMFQNLRQAIAHGLNVGFFSGNVCCGRIDPRPDSHQRPNRVFSRIDFYGPRDEAEIKRFPAMARLPHQSPNSNLLVGAGNIFPTTGGADWICAAPEHWIFEGTGLKRGEGIPGLVGWEWHGNPAAIRGLQVIASGPTQEAPGKLNGGVYTATIYSGGKGNFVFNASTCWWADALAEPPGYVRPSVYTSPNGPDPRAQRITANVLRRMGASAKA